MKRFRFHSPFITNESGVAIMQVVMAGGMLAIAAWTFLQFITSTDKNGMRMIRRNENLNFSTTISDYVNDSDRVRSVANVVDQVGAGPVIVYQ